MRKLIMWNVITLDGYFEGSKAWDLDFHKSVWGDELEALTAEQLETADIIVYGAKTYHGMADYWMTASNDPKAERLNSMPKVVCSTTIETPEWPNTTVVRDAVPELRAMKERGDGNMFVFGSAELSGALMKVDLFDEYRLCIAPVFLGNGRRLFNDVLPHQNLQLLEDRPLKTGGVILRYSPKR